MVLTGRVAPAATAPKLGSTCSVPIAELARKSTAGLPWKLADKLWLPEGRLGQREFGNTATKSPAPQRRTMHRRRHTAQCRAPSRLIHSPDLARRFVGYIHIATDVLRDTPFSVASLPLGSSSSNGVVT
jgi:hypothetical protein